MSALKLEEHKTNCCDFQVKGMHCAACELLVEKVSESIEGVASADAKLFASKLTLNLASDVEKSKVLLEINKKLKESGYEVIDEEKQTNYKKLINEFFYAIPIAIILLLLFANIQASGLINFSSEGINFPSILLLGFIASLSSCMAVVGGLVISISANYAKQGKNNNLQQVVFHVGRLGGFFILGGLLGLLGSVLKPSTEFTFMVTLFVGIMMIILGLNLLEISPRVSGLQLRTPKVLGKKILQLQELKKPYIPFTIGVVTFFLPCGFTQNVQLIALEAGTPFDSALIMFVFALGTLPALGLLSFASVNFAGKLKSGVFLKIAGIIVIAFAIWNIYGSLVARGLL